jgi:hypothetical protein
MPVAGATVTSMAATTATDMGTIALADQLIHLCERVPLSQRDVAAATGADEQTVSGWLERRAAPTREQAARLSELIAAVERLEVSTKRQVIPQWLRRKVPALGGKTPRAPSRARPGSVRRGVGGSAAVWAGPSWASRSTGPGSRHRSSSGRANAGPSFSPVIQSANRGSTTVCLPSIVSISPVACSRGSARRTMSLVSSNRCSTAAP